MPPLFGDQDKVKELITAFSLREPLHSNTGRSSSKNEKRKDESFMASSFGKKTAKSHTEVDDDCIRYIRTRRLQNKKINPAIILEQLDAVIKG